MNEWSGAGSNRRPSTFQEGRQAEVSFLTEREYSAPACRPPSLQTGRVGNGALANVGQRQDLGQARPVDKRTGTAVVSSTPLSRSPAVVP